MTKKFLEKFFKNGYAHILYALLVEVILLLLISFAGLFTLETILPGLISTRFVIGKIIIAVTLLVFFTAFLGRFLDITFSIKTSRSIQILLICGILWTLGISIVSLLSFPLWSIPIILLSFGAIGYLFYEEFKSNS